MMGEKQNKTKIFPETTRRHSFDILYVAMADDPLHKLWHSCPTNGHVPGGGRGEEIVAIYRLSTIGTPPPR